MTFTATWSAIDLAAAGDVIDGVRLNGAPATQVAAGLRAPAVKVFNRRNVTHTLAFINRRPPFASPDAAAQFQAAHAIAFLAVEGAADLEFTIGDTDYVLRDAVVTRREATEQFGTTVIYAYEITGGVLEEVP